MARKFCALLRVCGDSEQLTVRGKCRKETLRVEPEQRVGFRTSIEKNFQQLAAEVTSNQPSRVTIRQNDGADILLRQPRSYRCGIQSSRRRGEQPGLRT